VFGVLSLVFWAMTVTVTTKYLCSCCGPTTTARAGCSRSRRWPRPSAPPGAASAVADAARPVRCRPPLRRRDHHAGDLGAERRRGAERGDAARGAPGAAARGAIITALFVFQKGGTARRARCSGRSPPPGSSRWPRSASATSSAPPGARRGRPAARGAVLRREPRHGFLVLGSVVLVVTGGESLYTDLGHFGRRPIAPPGSRSSTRRCS
jgi:KUP system potassium uptake protein